MRAIAIGVLAAVVFLLATCGGQGARQAGPGLSGGAPAVDLTVNDPAGGDLASALAELDLLVAPEGVDAALFAELKEALRAELVGIFRGTSALKGASCLDMSSQEQVEIDGEQYLRWYYSLTGDYDLNGEVNGADLVPIALNFNEVISGDTPPAVAFIDGDGNGEINIADITAIALNFAMYLYEYSILRRPIAEADPQWSEMARVPKAFFNLFGDEELEMSYVLEPDYADFEYYVMPGGVTASRGNEYGTPHYRPPDTAALAGVIVDSAGDPVAGAEVAVRLPDTVAEYAATSDEEGLYLIKDIDLNGTAGYQVPVTVQCRKWGYANGVESSELSLNQCSLRDFSILEREVSASVSSLKGGSAVHKSTLSLSMPPNSLVGSDGQPLSGLVEVNLTYIDPTDAQMLDSAPGDFSARQLDDSSAQLESFGMAEVFIDDGTGQPANLAPGKTAALTFPIPESMQADAPDSTGLYSFDEETGEWVEEDRAYKNEAGTAYECEVGHFSYWNCDDPINPTHIAVRAVDMDGTPISNVLVTSAGVSYNGVTTQPTDGNGYRVFSVEQSATESISASYRGYTWEAVIVETPAEFLSENDAPVVVTFTLPLNMLQLDVSCTTPAGFPVPYAEIYLHWLDPLGIDLHRTGRSGEFTMLLQPEGDLEIWAEYDGATSAVQTVNLTGNDPISLVIVGAPLHPVARFSITAEEQPAPVTVALDGSLTIGGDGIESYHWTIVREGETVVDVSGSGPVLDGIVLDTPGHYNIKLEVLDSNGLSDVRQGSVCVYGPPQQN